MSRLEISLLGPLRVVLDGEPVTRFEADTARVLLAYLALHTDVPCRRETLAALLWPEQPEVDARHNLRQALGRLRTAIGDRDADPPFLLVTRKSIQLNPQADCSIDAAAFDQALAACGEHAHGDMESCPSCVQRLGEALRLYRGDLLAGFTLDSAPFEEWLTVERERRHRQALGALGRLTNYHETRGEYEQAERYARRQIELEPWREAAHRQLMRVLALVGQRGAALRQYEECARVLREELGVVPEKETTGLYRAIKEGQASAVAAPGAKRHRRERVSNMPVSLMPFVGREQEMATIAERLQDPDCRLLTLVGPGGIGKTRLAVEAAKACEDAFAHGVIFAALAALQSTDSVVPAVAQALGFSFYEEVAPREQLLDYLGSRNLLLILDNFEHLLSPSQGGRKNGARLVTDILHAAQDVKVLVTSRERLSVQGEHLVPVAGMDVPPSRKVQGMEEARWEASSAVRLFLHSARRVRPGFALTDDALTHVVQICRLVEGVPLAILLAATWIEMLTPSEIVEELGRGIDFLETDLRDVPARHRSMRAVLDASWRLLSSRERTVLEALSVFRGGFTRTAAQATTQSSLRDLMALTHKSLLRRTASGRYDLAHELLRQYATEKLQASGQGNAVRDAHCACYARFLGDRWADLKGRRQLAALDEIEADFENARAAWTWALEQKDFASVDRMLDSLDWFCVLRNRNLEHGELFGRAREELAPDPTSGGEAYLVWGRVLVADHYTRPHDLDSTPGDRVRVERALGIARRYGDRGLTAWGLRTLGHIAGVLEDYAASLSLYRESLTIYQEMGDRFQEAGCLSQLAQVHRMLGQPERSIALARQGLALAREIGDSFWVAVSLINTGTISFYTGNYAEAEQYYGDALASYRQLGHRQGVALSDVLLGRLAFLRGDFEETRALAHEALEIATDLGHRHIAERARSLDNMVAVTLGEEATQAHNKQGPGPAIEVPTHIDRFQVKRLLGAGGMALVYLAHDPDAGRDVAIRVPKPELMEHGWMLENLRREAETLSRLQHLAIPKCYGYADEMELAYIVVEFIDGKDLEAILGEQAGFLPPRDVVAWAVQICDALVYLHRQRPVPFIFRDMKPSNVILDRKGRIHLTDLGITVANQPGREHTKIGTAGYSPPEQYFGYSDARSDVYALGTTMHHLLTRRDPRKERPFSFHDAPPRSLNPVVSEALEAVVMKATEHNPLNRYQSAEEMRAALLVCL